MQNDHKAFGADERRVSGESASIGKTIALSSALLFFAPVAAFAQQATVVLPPVEVFATSPLGTGTNPLDIPGETQSVDSQEIDNLNQSNIQDVLARRVPGVSVTDEIGSPLSQSVDFRGETASPVPGTPQGLAVYMNGVRINESYGDVVNWDLIPPMAIDNAQIVTGNPVFGLNAIAGAVVMNMKNGFTWQGTEINVQGGTQYTGEGNIQYGVKKGNWALYVAMDGLKTDGYRYFGQSDVERGYADLGYRAEQHEVHLSITGAADGLGVAGTTPVDLIAQQGYASVFTTPQTTDTTAEMVTLSDQWHIAPTWQANGNVYFRNYAQAHVDGNISQFYHCPVTGDGVNVCNGGTPVDGSIAGTTPLGDPDLTQPDGQPMGEIDSNWTHTKSIGTTVQLTNTDAILDHKNTITGGISVDHGWTHFTGSSTLGTLPPDFVVQSYNELIDEPALDVSPVDVLAQNTYIGIYALDDFNVTDRFAIHAGARFNDAILNLDNNLGEPYAAVSQAAGTFSQLNSSATYNRINPVVGATFKITPDISTYASYSEANRAPTPLELGCSSPMTPCMIDNFLVADPPLKQIVARTVEAGFKGNNTIEGGLFPGVVNWSVAAYRTENQNDIYSAPSTAVPGFSYYTNAGDTLRQGVDAGATYTTDRWDAYVNYSFIKATFATPTQLESDNNPNANCGGNQGIECVNPGDNIPGIPNHKIKVGFDYTVFPKWKVGADVVYRSSQYYFGDEINSLPQISGFATINLRTSYQVSNNVQIFGQINNALNYRGATYGTLYEVSSTQNQTNVNNGEAPGICDAGLFCSANPRSITIAPPLEVLGGAKVTF